MFFEEQKEIKRTKKRKEKGKEKRLKREYKPQVEFYKNIKACYVRIGKEAARFLAVYIHTFPFIVHYPQEECSARIAICRCYGRKAEGKVIISASRSKVVSGVLKRSTSSAAAAAAVVGGIATNRASILDVQLLLSLSFSLCFHCWVRASPTFYPLQRPSKRHCIYICASVPSMHC